MLNRRPDRFIGYYNEYGYAVVNTRTNEEVYTAGNSKVDQSESLDPGSKNALDLATLRRYCERTTREIAQEEGGEYGGVELEQVGMQLTTVH